MLRQDAGRFMLGKYSSDKKIPSTNLRISLETRNYPPKKLAPPRATTSHTFVFGVFWRFRTLRNLNIHMLVYSGPFKNLPNIRALVYAGDSEAKETIGDGSGRKYANSHFSDQNRQDAISRVTAVQNRARVLR